MSIDWKWFVIGIVVGYFVIPRLHAAVVSKSAAKTA